MILISACLAGICCKYNGGNNEVPAVRELYEKGMAVPVCPEQLGGLPVPRKCSEIRSGRVVNTAGEDVTAQFEKGAREALRICRENGCEKAVLKEGSPSCGVHRIYDGTFSHTAVCGQGVFAQMLAEEGIRVLNEEEYMEESNGYLQ